MFGKIILSLIFSIGILGIGIKCCFDQNIDSNPLIHFLFGLKHSSRECRVLVQQVLGRIWMLLGAALLAFTLVMGAFAIGTGIVQIGGVMGIVTMAVFLMVCLSYFTTEIFLRFHLDTEGK